MESRTNTDEEINARGPGPGLLELSLETGVFPNFIPHPPRGRGVSISSAATKKLCWGDEMEMWTTIFFHPNEIGS